MKELKMPIKEHKSQYDVSHYLELIIRIIVGLFIILNGLFFFSHHTQIEEVLSKDFNFSIAEILVLFIGTVQFFGGVFIVIGLFTRSLIVLQIPAILLESYFIPPPNSFVGNSVMNVVMLMLIPLFFLFVRNSGAFSLDYYRMKKHQSKNNEKAQMIKEDK